jgi:hypothetical protein
MVNGDTSVAIWNVKNALAVCGAVSPAKSR